MIFSHHPRKEGPWTFNTDVAPYEQRGTGECKPRGFWLSVDDDWRRWCDDEDWGWGHITPILFDVDLSGVLHLNTPHAIDRFTEEYQITIPGGYDNLDGYLIDWCRVAERYTGIVIAPYQWSRRNRHGVSWYYGWDCASACIWDLSILKVRTLEGAE